MKTLILFFVVGIISSAHADEASALQAGADAITRLCEKPIAAYRKAGLACEQTDSSCFAYLYERANRSERDLDFAMDGSSCASLLQGIKIGLEAK
jgi:hypothetical protein